AVVAEEVRRLAEQSANAALEAGELVQDIHRQVGEVVEQMRRGQVNVGGVEEISSAALEAQDAIVAATAEATAHAQRIAAAAGEQDKAFGRLRERIHAVAARAARAAAWHRSGARPRAVGAVGSADARSGHRAVRRPRRARTGAHDSTSRAGEPRLLAAGDRRARPRAVTPWLKHPSPSPRTTCCK